MQKTNYNQKKKKLTICLLFKTDITESVSRFVAVQSFILTHRQQLKINDSNLQQEFKKKRISMCFFRIDFQYMYV